MTIPRPDKLPEWASVPQNDPNKPVPNIVEPPAAKKQLGWIFEEFPPSNWFNWLLNKIYKWVQYFDDQHVNIAPIFGIDTSVTVNQIEVTLIPPINDYVEGRLFLIKVANTNTGSSTLEIDGKGAWPILDLDGSSLIGGEIIQDVIYMFVFSEGAAPGQEHFILQSKPDFTTGDFRHTLKLVADPGWILYNSDIYDDTHGTIGDASSVADILADATAEKLFKLLWNNCADTECSVVGGRGANADIDWVAHKKIHIPNLSDEKVLAARIGEPMAKAFGEKTHILSVGEMPIHNHDYENKDALTNSTGGPNINIWQNWRQIPTTDTGSSDEHNNIQPTLYCNIMIKL